MTWDEAVKISGADSDFHRRDLWEAIEAGAYPEYELGIQIFTEEQADNSALMCSTRPRLFRKNWCRSQPVGRMVLNRNPDNFFAETEQVAFCAAHIVPGVDFSNDPLLAGRIHSYVDTQISASAARTSTRFPSTRRWRRLTTTSVTECIARRFRADAWPTSRIRLRGGCPFQAGMKGFTSFPETVREDKVRGKPEQFADHYTQATLFWNSQTPIEQAHIIRAYRFELTRVQTVAIRRRVLALLANVAEELAQGVAVGLGMEVPEPLPKAISKPRRPEVTESPALSLMARPGDGSIRTRRIAILVADGIDDSVVALHQAFTEAGAVPRYVGPQLGRVTTVGDAEIDVEITLEAGPAVLYDALVVPDGKKAMEILGNIGFAAEFAKDQYRHCKPILAVGAGRSLVENTGIPLVLPSGEPDPGLIAVSGEELSDAIPTFIEAMGKHRHFERETDPPAV